MKIRYKALRCTLRMQVEPAATRDDVQYKFFNLRLGNCKQQKYIKRK